MKIVKNKTLGSCNECLKAKKEVPAVIETKDGRKLCSLHTTSEALIHYASEHFRLSPKESKLFRDNLLLKLVREVIYNIDSAALDEFNILE